MASKQTEDRTIGCGLMQSNNGFIYKKPVATSYVLKPNFTYEYSAKFIDDTRRIGLLEDGEIRLEKDLVWSEDKLTLIESICKNIDRNKPGTLGAIFYGVPGSGKTTMANLISHYAKRPLIKLAGAPDWWELADLLTSINDKQNVAIIVDEADRYRYDEDALTFLDAKTLQTNQLIFFLSNTLSGYEQRMFNRCARIRYLVQFEAISGWVAINNMVSRYPEVKDVPGVTSFIDNNFTDASEDTISTFIDEMNLHNLLDEDTFDHNEAMKYAQILNVKLKSTAIKYVNKHPTELTLDSTVSDLWEFYKDAHQGISKDTFFHKFHHHFTNLMNDPTQEIRSLKGFANKVRKNQNE